MTFVRSFHFYLEFLEQCFVVGKQIGGIDTNPIVNEGSEVLVYNSDYIYSKVSVMVNKLRKNSHLPRTLIIYDVISIVFIKLDIV